MKALITVDGSKQFVATLYTNSISQTSSTVGGPSTLENPSLVEQIDFPPLLRLLRPDLQGLPPFLLTVYPALALVLLGFIKLYFIAVLRGLTPGTFLADERTPFSNGITT